MAARITRTQAHDTLQACGAPIPGDFHRLGTDACEALLSYARTFGYRHPANANGSKARYFHDYLQRVAARKG